MGCKCRSYVLKMMETIINEPFTDFINSSFWPELRVLFMEPYKLS